MNIVTIQDANRVGCCPCNWPLCEPPQKECQSFHFYGNACGFMNVDAADPSTFDRPSAYLTRVYTFQDNPPADIVSDYVPGLGTFVARHSEGVISHTRTESHSVTFEAESQCDSSERDAPTEEYAGGGTRTTTYTSAYFYEGAWVTWVSEVITDVWISVGGDETEEHIAWLAADPETRGDEPGVYYGPGTFRLISTTLRNPAPWETWEPYEDPLYVAYSTPPGDFVSLVYSDEVTWLDAHEAIQAWVDENCDFTRFDDPEAEDYCEPFDDCENRLELVRWHPGYLGADIDDSIPSYTEIRCRYRYGAPDSPSYAGYTAAHDDWVIAHAAFPALHAAWAAEDPETRGEEPLDPPEPRLRSVYQIDWDEILISAIWLAWFTGGMSGDEPSPVPSLIDTFEWIWEGDPDAPWSDWFVPAVPIGIPDPSPEYLAWVALRIAYEVAFLAWAIAYEAWASADPVVGTAPVAPTPPADLVEDYLLDTTANLMIICWHSTRLGTKPTATGPQVALP